MKSPPKIEKSAERVVSTHSADRKENPHDGSVHKSANIQVTAWSILPDDRAGLEVTIGDMGHVVLTQHRPLADEAAIVLHPVEALALHGILPDAIAAANEHRRTL